jgi:Ankyrin repeats (many copies)
VAEKPSTDGPWWFALLGFGRAGRILYVSLFVLAIPVSTAWLVLVPRLRFHEADEQLFRAARHGDVAGIERALAGGAKINAEAPIDTQTALFRAAAFGHADAVRALLKDGADVDHRGRDGRPVLQFAEDARKEEKDPARVHALDLVIDALKAAQR